MGFKENALRGGFIIFVIVVQAFTWLDDFLQVWRRRGDNWNWIVSICVFDFVKVFGNGAVIVYIYESWSTEPRRKSMPMLLVVSVLQLAFTAPAWHAVRQYRWAELLREAGHDDHAHHIDVFCSIGKATIVYRSVIGFICLVVVLCGVVSALLYRRSMRSWWKGYNQRQEHPIRLQADPDTERGDNQKVGRRPTSAPLARNPTFAEEDHSRW
jgi:hypothetical protein